MKRAAPWNEAYPISSADSSDSSSEDDGPKSTDCDKKNVVAQSRKAIMSEANSGKKKRGVIDYEALSRHGYRGGLSVFKVPPPRVADKDRDWSWSTGKREDTVTEETYEEREHTRAVISETEKVLSVQRNLQTDGREKKNASFSQKEKRKRELGQASRGKNYVEEEKRLLRDSGVYSGFDS